jgi:cobalt-zinc-cadmium efflux system protein
LFICFESVKSIALHKFQEGEKGKRLVIAILLNLLITLGQLIGGIISGSISLISDALHNFSDVIALIISYVATILVRKKHTLKRTFGFKRAEIIAAFVNASILIAIAIYLSFEAIDRFYDPIIIESFWIIVFASFSIVLNGLSVILLHRDAEHSMNIRSSYIHLLSDMFTSIAVLVGGILISLYEIYWIDGVLTLMIAIYLIYTTWKILTESLKVLMLFTPSGIDLEKIREDLTAIAGVGNIHHVHVWQLNENNIHFEAHVDFTENIPLAKVNAILDQIRKKLHSGYNIDHVTLQPELDVCHGQDLVSHTH